jgi:carbon storage regulator CsrA
VPAGGVLAYTAVEPGTAPRSARGSQWLDAEAIMLILARKAGESIRIGDEVKVTVIRVRRNEIRLGFEAPDDVQIRTPEQDAAEAEGAGPDAGEDE